MLRCRRSPEAAVRAELLALARARAGMGEGWLNRDAHLVFTVSAFGPRLLRTWNVSRGDEDMLRELDETGRVAATAEVFSLMPVTTDVHRYTSGAIITKDADGQYAIEELGPGRPGGRIRRAAGVLRGQRRARKAGLLHAGVDELRELTAQFRDAEFAPVADSGEGKL